MSYIFPEDQTYSITIKDEAARFPIHRIFCVGRNYAAHAAEMGVEVDREAPFYFTKTPSAAVMSGAKIAYPSGTANYHYEMELAIMIGKPVFRANLTEAKAAIYGYSCALDMTRRDLQLVAREKSRPWDLGKDVEQSAVFAPITKAADFDVQNQRIHLEVNGEVKQDAVLEELIWKIEEIIADLSKFYHLRAGDVILTGTPAGVGPVVAGDKITGGIDGLEPIALEIGAAE